MTDRPLRLGPDPNRTHLERWNTMYPDRYGRPDTPAHEGSNRLLWHGSEDDDSHAPGVAHSPGNELLDAVTGLVILGVAAVIGFAVTSTVYRLTSPDSLTATWLLGYVGVFAASSFISAALLYAMRRIVLALILSAIAFGSGYALWHLWLA